MTTKQNSIKQQETILLFSNKQAKEIEETHCIPPTFVGVRRVRPSNSAVQIAFRNESSKKRKRRNETNHDVNDTAGENLPEEGKKEKIQKDGNSVISAAAQEDTEKQILARTQKHQYHTLQVDPQSLAEELAELQSDKGRALPAVLSPPMVGVAHRLLSDGVTEQKTSTSSNSSMLVEVDDDYAKEWARQLNQTWLHAHETRNQEKMRRMVYRLHPEVWTRLRPRQPTLSANPKSTGHDDNTNSRPDDQECCFQQGGSDESSAHQFISCSNIRCKPMQPFFDLASLAIYQCLHRNFENLRISCGAKFGCDYLLYDGHRKDRHAFAGLRVCLLEKDTENTDDYPEIVVGECSTTSFRSGDTKSKWFHRLKTTTTTFPSLNVFELSGFVRVLNTAGKLALLALVQLENVVEENQKDEEEGDEKTSDSFVPKKGQRIFCKVSIIDLALEKILSANHHHCETDEEAARKVVGRHLSKKFVREK